MITSVVTLAVVEVSGDVVVDNATHGETDASFRRGGTMGKGRG